LAGSVSVAERVWREVRDTGILALSSAGLALTLSVGVALYPSRDVRAKDALLRAADEALRQAKQDGGDRICVYQQRGHLFTPLVGDGGLGQESGGERGPQ